MKLNLGCGHKHMEGFVNVDLADNWADKQPDVSADITQRLPFEDNTADEIHAYHVLEHIYRWRVNDVLTDWVRVLKPGGLLVLEMPCLDKILLIFNRYVQTGKTLEPRLTMWGLYGDPRYKNEAMVHKWCYPIGELEQLARLLNLKDVKILEPKTQVADRDIRLEATKCSNCS